MALLSDELRIRPADGRLRPMGSKYDLHRFVRAQAGIYPRALAELQAGAKTTHWMWFIFPQVLGLGNSRNARLYAIEGLDEARAYFNHDLLGPRLLECTDAMLDWAGRKSALDILGVIDAMKFHSSMTLFEKACPEEPRFAAALDGYFDGRRDWATLDRLIED